VKNDARAMLRYGLPAVAVLAAVVTVAVVSATRSGEEAGLGNTAAPAAPGTATRFAVLSKASSNQCGLRAAALSSIARRGRLQGSCCSRMDLHRYREQVRALRRYADVAEIPRDPYDIPVALARRLTSYNATIKLSDEEQAIYDRAMKLEGGHGPCCCQCWRWDAFSGQAKYLIARRRFTAQQVAQLWVLEDGCGGASHEHHSS
jgi:hypothetical protein